jgi:hypothetical protein
MRWIPLCLVLLAFFSCKKDEHAIPAIKMEWMGNQGPFGFGDAINVNVEANVIGNEKIEKITLHLSDGKQKIWLSSTAADALPSHSYQGQLSLELNDPYLPSGQYFLKVTAYTAHTSKSAFLECTIIELQKKRRNIFVINNNGFAGAMIDTLSFSMQMGPWRSSLGARYLPMVNSYNKSFWSCQSGQSTLEMMDISNLYSELFSYPFSGSNDYFMDADHDDANHSIWFSTQDGMRQFDKNGQFSQWIPGDNQNQLCVTEKYLCVNQKTPGQPGRLKLYLKTTSSLIHSWVHGLDIIDVFDLDGKIGLITLNNGVYGISLFDLETLLPINWHPLLSYSSNNFQCLTTGNGLWIGDENGLHHWDNQGEWNNTWGNYHPIRLASDKTEPLIWMIDDGQLKGFHYLTQQEVYQSADNGYSELAIGYNK